MPYQDSAGIPLDQRSAPLRDETDPTGVRPGQSGTAPALWAAWIERAFGLWLDAIMPPQQAPAQAWWDHLSPELLAGRWTEGPVLQLGAALAGNPLLRATEEVLNINPLHDVIPVDWAEMLRALRTVWLRLVSHPQYALAIGSEVNLRVFQSTVDVWTDTWLRWWGLRNPEPKPIGVQDKRFNAAEWLGNPAYRLLMEFYLIASDWLLGHASKMDDLTPSQRQHLDFHLRQFVNAMSPTLLLATNPVALRKALETGGVSLADGTRNLLHDLKQGQLSMVDKGAFTLGRDLALSPGKVVYRNSLIELIQYQPNTKLTHSIPLLILPPWINKYYILDLQPRNSMVRHLVDQGFSVFIVSWRNPDASMENTSIEDYLELGPLAASNVVREITGSSTANVMGYCIGGTLLAMTLAWLAARQDNRFAAATFIVSLLDFSKVGDTAVFMNEPTAVDFIEQQMLHRGYLDSREMSTMFNLLRSNDLIWSNVVNNYLLGQKPPAFDLLYWNADGTRMARAAHSWYLRNTYVENNLIMPNRIRLKGEMLDLGRISQDIYAVGAERDHIVPWHAAWQISHLVAGKVRFVLASSGHIAGIINPPGGKGMYWSGAGYGKTPEQWRGRAERHEGSWWEDWFTWLASHSGKHVTPPTIGSAAHPPLQDAPGSYVRER